LGDFYLFIIYYFIKKLGGDGFAKFGPSKNDEIFEMDEYIVKNQETFDTLRFLFQTSKGGVHPCTLGKWLLLHEESSQFLIPFFPFSFLCLVSSISF
jgi:hypothetical protein